MDKILGIFAGILIFSMAFGAIQTMECNELKKNIADLQVQLEQKQIENARLLAMKTKATKAGGQKTAVAATTGEQTLAQKNNNPLNVKVWVKGKPYWQGQIGTDEFNHAIFADKAYGFRAAALTLRSYAMDHKINTLEQIVDRFSEAKGKHRANYIAHLSKELKLGAKQEFDIIPRIPDLLKAMSKFESGEDHDPKYYKMYDILAKL